MILLLKMKPKLREGGLLLEWVLHPRLETLRGLSTPSRASAFVPQASPKTARPGRTGRLSLWRLVFVVVTKVVFRVRHTGSLRR